MKMKTSQLSLIIFLSFIIILIMYLFYINKISSLQQKKEGFISKFYRPYYRTIKRGLSNYYNFFLNY